MYQFLGLHFGRDFWHKLLKSSISHTITPSRARFNHLAHDYCVGSSGHSPQKHEKPRQIALPRLLSIWYSCARSLKVPFNKVFLNRAGCKRLRTPIVSKSESLYVITQHYRFLEIAFRKSVYDSKKNLMHRTHLSFDSSVVSETAPSSRSVTT